MPPSSTAPAGASTSTTPPGPPLAPQPPERPELARWPPRMQRWLLRQWRLCNGSRPLYRRCLLRRPGSPRLWAWLSLRLGRRRRSGSPWSWLAARQREERRGLVARERVVLVPVEEGVLARLVLQESRQVGHLRGAEHTARLEHGVRSHLVEPGRRHVDLVLIVLTGRKLRHPGGQEVAPSVEPAHAQPSLHLVAVVDPRQDLLDASHPRLGVWPRPQQHALVSIIPPTIHLSRERRASRKYHWTQCQSVAGGGGGPRAQSGASRWEKAQRRSLPQVRGVRLRVQTSRRALKARVQSAVARPARHGARCAAEFGACAAAFGWAARWERGRGAMLRARARLHVI